MLKDFFMNLLMKKRNKEYQELLKLKWQKAELEKKIEIEKRKKAQLDAEQ